MSNLQTFYPEARYGGFSRVDGTIAFFSRVNAMLQQDFTVLDVGCGRGEFLEDPVPFRRDMRILKGKCKEVVGIDVDEAARTNPYIDRFAAITGDTWPVATGAIDLCVCDHVVEHIDDVHGFFSECARVVKPGGYLCIRTPNSHSYVAVAARLIPNRKHAQVLSTVQERRKAEDVFPTRYRCNTRSALSRTLAREGFTDCVVYSHEAEPSYLNFSRFLYRLGVLHQRLSPSALKPILFAFARRQQPM